MSKENKVTNQMDIDELRKQSQAKEVQIAEYAMNEQMTIPDFVNQINKDSAWSKRK